ncbi:glutaminyl-peptide cyclotransferase [Chondrinema litorale]|uniref:glutaminyl-peptide cyclotransferase n=1 Tax=Chondrinema litorale TaxID=2994555 RepID=UPI002542B015|nr:glutaminyl-peptide cyclotransferase [Chondrinema litorale]UZR95134.1 glutaminyl-peptide cyclotransferase [Chondrinema litorale]
MKFSGNLFLVVLILLLAASSCGDTNKPPKLSKDEKKERKQLDIRKKPVTGIQFDTDAETFKTGDSIALSIVPLKGAPGIDTVTWLIDGRQKFITDTEPFSFGFNTEDLGTGKHIVTAMSKLADQTRDRRQETIELFSDVVPEEYSYNIINEYPHDGNAWTQGLLIVNGELFEGTGRKGSSSLRKVNIKTGEIIQFRELDATLFGEGIVIFNDEIFQLTYQSRVGKVYDKETFQFKRDFQYATEGWGLTTNGTYLIMSDGSNILYYMDPGSFTEVKRIEVYNNKGPVDQLNELEFINGEIYANIWQTDRIVRIDPKSGKVLGEIDLSGLREKAITPQKGDVLNGIAYDKDTDKLYVTGKWWTKLFEIKLKK